MGPVLNRFLASFQGLWKHDLCGRSESGRVFWLRGREGTKEEPVEIFAEIIKGN